MADTLQAPPNDPERAVADCPECGAAGAVLEFFCEVCYAELDEASDDG